MKKFKFSLQALLNYKETLEKTQKADLKRAQQALRELLDEEARLLRAYADNERSLERALQTGKNIAAALSEHDAYFRFLRDALIELRERIVKAEQVRDKCMDILIKTMKELKTYNKLRDEQYQSYKKEILAEESKEIDDLVSFKIIDSGLYSTKSNME